MKSDAERYAVNRDVSAFCAWKVHLLLIPICFSQCACTRLVSVETNSTWPKKNISYAVFPRVESNKTTSVIANGVHSLILWAASGWEWPVAAFYIDASVRLHWKSLPLELTRRWKRRSIWDLLCRTTAVREILRSFKTRLLKSREGKYTKLIAKFLQLLVNGFCCTVYYDMMNSTENIEN